MLERFREFIKVEKAKKEKQKEKEKEMLRGRESYSPQQRVSHSRWAYVFSEKQTFPKTAIFKSTYYVLLSYLMSCFFKSFIHIEFFWKRFPYDVFIAYSFFNAIFGTKLAATFSHQILDCLQPISTYMKFN